MSPLTHRIDRVCCRIAPVWTANRIARALDTADAPHRRLISRFPPPPTFLLPSSSASASSASSSPSRHSASAASPSPLRQHRALERLIRLLARWKERKYGPLPEYLDRIAEGLARLRHSEDSRTQSLALKCLSELSIHHTDAYLTIRKRVEPELFLEVTEGHISAEASPLPQHSSLLVPATATVASSSTKRIPTPPALTASASKDSGLSIRLGKGVSAPTPARPIRPRAFSDPLVCTVVPRPGSAPPLRFDMPSLMSAPIMTPSISCSGAYDEEDSIGDSPCPLPRRKHLLELTGLELPEPREPSSSPRADSGFCDVAATYAPIPTTSRPASPSQPRSHPILAHVAALSPSRPSSRLAQSHSFSSPSTAPSTAPSSLAPPSDHSSLLSECRHSIEEELELEEDEEDDEDDYYEDDEEEAEVPEQEDDHRSNHSAYAPSFDSFLSAHESGEDTGDVCWDADILSMDFQENYARPANAPSHRGRRSLELPHRSSIPSIRSFRHLEHAPVRSASTRNMRPARWSAIAPLRRLSGIWSSHPTSPM